MPKHEGRYHIAKEELKVGEYYVGHCRNANVARWDGIKFWYWREKFGSWFIESIRVPEDDDGFDLFYASSMTCMKEIPLPQ